MKKLIATGTTLALLAAFGAPNAAAGDRGWATAGKVLTGVGAGLFIAKAFEPAPVYQTTVVYQTAPVVYAAPPQPVVVQQVAPVVVAPQQVVYQQPVVVQQPAQVVYVQPAPVVYVQPAPVYYSRPYYGPVCYGPAVSVNFRFGGGHGHFRR